MRKRISVAIAAAAVVGAILYPSAASAYYGGTAYSGDGSAWGSVEVTSAATFTLQDSHADGRGPILYYKIGSTPWGSFSNGKGAGGQVVYTPSIVVSPGKVISWYVCNVNTQTGYRSCGSTKTITA
ncbi:hypothetical protein CTKZ_06570 [Cellulomonas algicola]|uniref:Uncharacterized protein n=1 Tax=Cellulomonas algicola TaxID=2071633 RepID=A0A401UWN6_9CELL|nr:hypothetical protein [Cellulomonas algicola]GCD19095.1 hypothetical protein CTKZ_06570 [Cellulomonas algicola]